MESLGMTLFIVVLIFLLVMILGLQLQVTQLSRELGDLKHHVNVLRGKKDTEEEEE